MSAMSPLVFCSRPQRFFSRNSCGGGGEGGAAVSTGVGGGLRRAQAGR